VDDRATPGHDGGSDRGDRRVPAGMMVQKRRGMILDSPLARPTRRKGGGGVASNQEAAT